MKKTYEAKDGDKLEFNIPDKHTNMDLLSSPLGQKLLADVPTTHTFYPEAIEIDRGNGAVELKCPHCDGIVVDAYGVYFEDCPHCGKRFKVNSPYFSELR